VGLAYGQEIRHEQKWSAEVKASETAYSTARLAILKIDDATYIAPGRRAWLTPTGEVNGKVAWKTSPGKNALVEVAATNNTVSVRIRGESIAFRRETLDTLSINEDIDLQFHPIQVRAGVWGVNVFAYNQANPAAAAFAGLSYYPYDPAYRVEAVFEPGKAEPVDFLTVDGITKRFWKVGAAQFDLKGTTLELPLYSESGSGPKMSAFFLDGAAGNTTFGGGRYVDVESVRAYPPKTVTIDFNTARNPLCARASFYKCSPSKDRLAIAIEAGEKAPPAGSRLPSSVNGQGEVRVR
jgi:uncharacterized protein (DUF1684 family)